MDFETFKNLPITSGKFVSRYYEIWTKPCIAKVTQTTELDVAYGYAKDVGELKGLKFERYHSTGFLDKHIRDDKISHIYYFTFEELHNNIPILFSYYYMVKVDFKDEIVCLQQAEEVDGSKIYLPLSFKHTEEDLLKMFYSILNLRFNLIKD